MVGSSRQGVKLILVVAIMLLAMLAVAAPAQAFQDVKPTDWYAGSLQMLVDAKLIDDIGLPFRPNDPVTRAELASMIRRAIQPPLSHDEPFSDVGPNDWFRDSVASLFQAYVINGTSATTFAPHRPIDRQQAASLIVRALDYKMKNQPPPPETGGAEPQPEGTSGAAAATAIDLIPAEQILPWTFAFPDRWFIADVHKHAVGNAYRLTLMDPDVGGWFYPWFPIDRAQAVSLIARAFIRPIQMRPLPAKVEPAISYPPLQSGSSPYLVRWVEGRLASMAYPVGPVDGIYDYRTTTGVMAFQKVEGLSRDGVFGAQCWDRIRSAVRPSPRVSRSGSRTEIDLSKQVLLQIQNNQVVKIVPVSTGAPGMGTPSGAYRIQRKITGWHESRLGMLYSPSYFYGGYAIHGSRSVPGYPASHGCVRTPMWLSDGLYSELFIGRAVDIYR